MHRLGSDPAREAYSLNGIRRLDVIAGIAIRRGPADVGRPRDASRHLAWRRNSRGLDGHLGILLSPEWSKTTSNSPEFVSLMTTFRGRKGGVTSNRGAVRRRVKMAQG